MGLVNEGLSLASIFLGLLALVVVLALALRSIYFQSKHGEWSRRDAFPIPIANDEHRSSELLHHNEAIHKLFDAFLKLALAILGGAAYLVSSSDRLSSARPLLAQSGWIMLFVSVAFGLLIATHMRSKIQRFKFGYRFWEPLLWREPWMIALVIQTGLIYRFFVLPSFLK